MFFFKVFKNKVLIKHKKVTYSNFTELFRKAYLIQVEVELIFLGIQTKRYLYKVGKRVYLQIWF